MKDMETLQDEATIVIIFSDAFAKQILKKVYIDLPFGEPTAKAMNFAMTKYPEFVRPNIRVDIYKVRNGLTIGGI